MFPDLLPPSYATGHIRLSQYHQARQHTTVSYKKFKRRLSAKPAPHCLDFFLELRPLRPDFFVAGWKFVAVRAGGKILLYGTFFGLAIKKCPFGFAAFAIQLLGVHLPLLCHFSSQLVVVVLRSDIDVTLIALQAAVSNHREIIAVQHGLLAT